MKFLELVSKGHPDKVADYFSDLVLDWVKWRDQGAKCAVETMIKGENFYFCGEVSSALKIDFDDLTRELDTQARKIGYKKPHFTFDIQAQSSEIAVGVDKGGAGDQGIMYGYAKKGANYVPNHINYIETVGKILDRIASKNSGSILYNQECKIGWDFKVLLVYDEVLSRPHHLTVAMQCKNDYFKPLYKEILYKISKSGLELPKTFVLNGTGVFEHGGTYADCGLTGRKTACDTYYGLVPHGGGAFSGKDFTKVDRSATYYLRWLAIQLVEANVVDEIIVGVCYTIGINKNFGVTIKYPGQNQWKDQEIMAVIDGCFDLTATGVSNAFHVAKYSDIAGKNHLTAFDVPWNTVDKKKVDEIVEFADKYRKRPMMHCASL